MMKGKLVFLFSFAVLLFFASFASAETVITIPNPLCPGGTGSNGCIDSVASFVTMVTVYIATIIGSLAIIVFLYAAIMLVASAGDAGRIQKGKDAMKAAVIGLVIAFAGGGLVMTIQSVIGPPPSSNNSTGSSGHCNASNQCIVGSGSGTPCSTNADCTGGGSN